MGSLDADPEFEYDGMGCHRKKGRNDFVSTLFRYRSPSA